MSKTQKSEHSDKIFRDWNGQKYEKTGDGWSRVKESKTEPSTGQKEYSDEELDKYARSASDMGLKKASQSGNERMRVAAKREMMRRRNEGVDAPAPSGNPFDDAEDIKKGQEVETFEKGKKANIGEVRDWNGQKYQKTVNGWVPVKQGANPSNQKTELTGDQKKFLDKFYDPQDAYNHFEEFNADTGKETYQDFVEWASDGRDVEMAVETLVEKLGITEEQALELDKEYNEKLIKDAEKFFDKKKETDKEQKNDMFSEASKLIANIYKKELGSSERKAAEKAFFDYVETMKSTSTDSKSLNSKVNDVKDWIGDDASDQEISDVLDAVSDFVPESMFDTGKSKDQDEESSKIQSGIDNILNKYREHFDHWDGLQGISDEKLKAVLWGIFQDKKNS